MSSHGHRAAAVVSITAILLALPAHAHADTVTWAMAPCVTVDSMELAAEHPSRFVVIEGWVTQCGPAVDNGGFRLATYQLDAPVGVARGYNVRLFGSAIPGAARHFGAAVVPKTPGEYGVCVLAGQLERVACSRVVVTAEPDGVRPAVQPLASDAPLVDKSVVTTPYTGAITPPTKQETTDPACGTCF
jgi:hypothetical protein